MLVSHVVVEKHQHYWCLNCCPVRAEFLSTVCVRQVNNVEVAEPLACNTGRRLICAVMSKNFDPYFFGGAYFYKFIFSLHEVICFGYCILRHLLHLHHRHLLKNLIYRLVLFCLLQLLDVLLIQRHLQANKITL